MAASTCLKCGSTNFEIKENTPHNSNFKLMFVQCSTCGGVVGVQEYHNIGGLVKTLAKKLNVGSIESK